jgi:hypothetical protein
MSKKLQTFPSAPMPLDAVVEIQVPKPLGVTAKVLIHERARKLPLYNEKIKCDVKGQDKNGKKIAVNTIGRWLFGVPGYEGHIRISSVDDIVSVYYPKKSLKVVNELINSIKDSVEAGK